MKNNSNKTFFFILSLASAFLSIVVFLFTNLTVNNKLTAQKDSSQTASCTIGNLTGEISNESLGWFEGKQLSVPKFAESSGVYKFAKVLGDSADSKWIEVDLSEQKLRAWDGDQLYLETLISTGLPGMATPTGEFRIWVKLKATKMEGGVKGTHSYYYLPNVPYVMFFSNNQVPRSKGYSLHGTYWHNDFGNRRSHGCVNLPTSVAEQLYYWVNPELPEGKRMVYSNENNPGTKIVIHE